MKYNALINELMARNLWKDCSDLLSLNKLLQDGEKLSVYAGFDMTADSLHVGNLIVLNVLKIFHKYGHNVIILLGGATTRIGDPSGKNELRKVLTEEQISRNKTGIVKSITNIFGYTQDMVRLNLDNEIVLQSSDKTITITDNNYWLRNISYLDILTKVGRHFSMARMLSMESVSARLERNESLTFLEFNYMILQAYDFYYLSKKYNCSIQIGGSDQWGNIIQGVDLIGALSPQEKVFALTFPLITTSDGKKMGKSVDGAIWLNEDKLDPYKYFQYFRNIADNDIEKFYYLYSNLDPLVVKKKIDQAFTDGDKAINQLKSDLALEVTTICHGKEAAKQALNSSINNFITGSLDIEKAVHLEMADVNIIDLLLKANLVPSKAEAKRMIQANGVKINKSIVNEAIIINRTVLWDNFANEIQPVEDGKNIYFLLQLGKKNHITISLKVK